MDIYNLRYYGAKFPLADWALFQVKGSDALTFLQGQTTNDVTKINDGGSLLTTRLTRQGRVFSYFYIAKAEEKVFLLILNKLAEKTINDLSKFIIMDDVEFEKVPLSNATIRFTPNSTPLKESLDSTCSFEIDFFGENGLFSWGEKNILENDFPLIEDLAPLKVLNGFPEWGVQVSEDNLLNETYLNEVAISYSKGCFLGQETVSKIQNNRGAAKFPVLLKLKQEKTSSLPFAIGTDLILDGKKIGSFLGSCLYGNEEYIQASLIREFRIESRNVNFSMESTTFQGEVIILPFFKDKTPEEKSKSLYKDAVKLFQADKEKEAIDLLSRAIEIDPSYPDSYESLGVIYGRHENYVKAIELMDELLKVAPDSIMAHTNKSLYLMKIGKIEEAEKEKDLATVKSFKKAGTDAKNKKLEEENLKRKESEIIKRESMFCQVLEMDEFDLIANFGMADICFQRKAFEKAINYLEKVLDNNPKYSNAYLLLGKTFEGLEKKVEAIEVYEKGIPVASLNGDMMPANEMQGRLLVLK